MSQHARPHLETHTRGNGHSAVAGAAYRLGLRLYDRRTGCWHDYRRRKAGEEIVRALTVAPAGAPDWATDPEELWNRVEAAEKRKDAQVARDYRIPIPFGLADGQAGDLAEAMARFIADELTTSVSMGLHRDADVDALGNVKPKDKQGYHAHLYFPTRQLEASTSDGATTWALGAKMARLANKNTSGVFVEKLNAHWADLANRFTAAQGLTADYDHRSYVRQGIDCQPSPTLGQAATAMERKGIPTRKGDALRGGDIVVPSEVYKAVHAIVLEAQHEQALADVAREAKAAGRDELAASAQSDAERHDTSTSQHRGEHDAKMETSPDDDRRSPGVDDWLAGLRSPDATDNDKVVATAQDGDVPPGTPAETPESATQRRRRISLPIDPAAGASMARRFHASLPVPTDPVERAARATVLRIVRLIQQALTALLRLTAEIARSRERQTTLSVCDVDVEMALRDRRHARSRARRRLAEWEAEHPWRMKAAKVLKRDLAKRQGLLEQISTADHDVQDLKGTLRLHADERDRIRAEEAAMLGEERDAHARLGKAVRTLKATGPEHTAALARILTEEERRHVGLPIAQEGVEEEPVPAPERDRRLQFTPEARRVPH